MTTEPSISTTGGGAFLLKRPEVSDIFIPEEFTQEQRELAGLASTFSTREVFSKAEKIEAQEKGLMPALLKAAGERGLFMADIPEQYGGLGLGRVSSTIISEYITHQGSFSAAFLCHTGIGMLPVLYYGNEEQKKRYLPKLTTGEMLGAYSLTEAAAGTDAMGIKTKASLSPDKKYYFLNGEKIFCTNGGFADLITVFAKLDGGQMTAFLVERSFEGISFGREEDKMGILGSSTVPVYFSNAKVPAENVLGEIGKGHKIAFNILNIGRWKLGSACVGGMKRIIETTAPYANERYQFGKQISSFELIRQKIARSFVLAYLTESLVYRLAGSLDHAMAIEDFLIEASIAKVFGSEALQYVADEGVQIFGGYGFIRQYAVEQHYRDCRINRIFEGTNEINRLIIVKELMRRAMGGALNLMGRLNEILAGLKSGFPDLDPSTPMGWQINSVEMLKRLAIYISGVAFQKFAGELEAHQAVLALIADLIMEIYALESGLIRAIKVVKLNKNSTLYEAVITLAIAERIPPLVARARQALINIAKADAQTMAPYLAAFDRISRFVPVDTDAISEKIASHVLNKEAYGL